MDDIVERLRQYTSLTCSACETWGKCGYGEPCFCACHIDPCREAADEIERLRALCNDLYHDATCAESFCRLCGEGIREWEATRG